MYEFIPSKKNKKSSKLSLCLLIGAFALFASASLIPGLQFVGVFQTLSFFLLGFGILIITRYVTKNFIYGIKQRKEEGLDFTITELQGKRQITVCRISLSGINELLVCNREELKAQKKNIRAKKIKFFNYCTDIYEDKILLIYAEECGEKLAIMTTYDQKLFELLKQD